MEKTTKVVINRARLSYCHLFEAHAVNANAKQKYSVSILVDKKDVKTIEAIKAAVNAAAAEGKSSKFGGKIPVNIKLPLRDGDTERDDEAYKGMYFINASSINAPSVLERLADGSMVKVIDDETVYSGCYAAVSVNFYPFNAEGNKGVACGLNGVLKIEEGPRLSGGGSAAEDFTAAGLAADANDVDLGLGGDECPY